MESGSGEVLVLTTVGDRERAEAFCHRVVEKRLVACATCLPQGKSFYFWESAEVTADSEHLLLLKTHRDKLAELEEFFSAEHPYQCPEFLVFEVAGTSMAYRDWVHGELRLKRSK